MSVVAVAVVGVVTVFVLFLLLLWLRLLLLLLMLFDVCCCCCLLSLIRTPLVVQLVRRDEEQVDALPGLTSGLQGDHLHLE